jgi:hypothetical protein
MATMGKSRRFRKFHINDLLMHDYGALDKNTKYIAYIYRILRLKQSLAGRLCTGPVPATRLAPVSRQGFGMQILAEQLTHFIRELL